MFPSRQEINEAFENGNDEPCGKYRGAKIKQFTQGFALLFIQQRDYFAHWSILPSRNKFGGDRFPLKEPSKQMPGRERYG
jgi:hypothetical protein